MVIEMLLNNDIQKNCSNDFTFSTGNKCNYVHYWTKNQNKFESFYLNKILIRLKNFKVYILIIFLMKYLINRMQCNILSQQMGWLNGKGVCFILKVKALNFTTGVCMVNNGKLTKYSPI
jgi:hypothetical protein